MFKPKLSTVFYLSLVYYLQAVNADCTLHVEEEAPLISKTIGKKLFKIPSDGTKIFTLNNGESLNAHCSNELFIRRDNNYNNINQDRALSNVIFKCLEERGYYQVFYDDFNAPSSMGISTSSPNVYIKCLQGSQKLHESSENLPNCQNYTSFGIGAQFKLDKLAVIGICFDFETLTTKYVKYLAHRPKYELLDGNSVRNMNRLATHIMRVDKPVEPFDILFKDLSQINFNMSYDVKKRLNPLLSAHEFELLNLVQDTKISADVKDFEYLLNTVWWRNLRLGSWNLFLQALKKRTEIVKYIVYTGTSGKVVIPSSSNCKSQENGITNIFDTELKSFNIPEIIWMYLKPLNSNKSDEFVVFGYNTPFYSTATETIKCEDVCKEIDWLYDGDFGKIHLLPSFGVVHCCRPKEIALQLDIFPEEEIVSKIKTTTLTDKALQHDLFPKEKIVSTLRTTTLPNKYEDYGYEDLLN